MVVGSGLIARAIMAGGGNEIGDTCFYAAGVSNSGCQDEREFLRERARLNATIASFPVGALVYFSTCSIEDPAAKSSGYVKHKIQMENVVRERENYLILRLPQVAGRTPNPHTLLNYLYARIARSERFEIWSNATRNIIDVEDVARIAIDLIVKEGARNETINIANPQSYKMTEIVAAMERVLGARAVYDSLEKGACISIDVDRISTSISRCAIKFGDAYLGNTIGKYYGNQPTA